MGATQRVVTKNAGAPSSTNTQRAIDLAKKREDEAKAKAAAEAKAKAEADAKAAAEKAAADKAAADKAAKTKAEANPLYGLSDAEIQKYAQAQATKERFGGEFSWLDPAFQMDPALMGKSAAASAAADPDAIAAQKAAGGLAAKNAQRNLTFDDPALQKQLLTQIMGQATNTGPGALTFDNGARQGEQYQNYRDIIAGGGATSIEMADRAKARADSEGWLRGQREADMADYAERGLTGSGMEMLALSTDRQGAAGRNSMADLQMAKDLEARRLDAIKQAGGLATDMRSNTIDEQALLDRARTSGFSTAKDLVNTMREQTRLEQIGNANAQQSALDTWGRISDQARNSSFDEDYKRGTAADDVMKGNVDIINGAKDSNLGFLRDEYDSTMERSMDRWKELLNNGTLTAKELMEIDQKDNIFGSAQAKDLGVQGSDAFNKYQDAYNKAKLGANDPTQVLNAQDTTNKYIGAGGAVVGSAVDEIIKAYTGGGAIEAASSVAGGAKGATGTSTSAATAQGPTLGNATSQYSILDPETLKKLGYA